MKLKNILIALILSWTISCTPVKLVPEKNQSAITLVETTEQTTATFYQSMVQSDNKEYSQYANGYKAILDKIDIILALDSTRPKAGAIIGIANDIKNRFLRLEQIHKDAGTLNNAEIVVLDDEIHNLWETLHNAEINYK